jgi:hypothetical protein
MIAEYKYNSTLDKVILQNPQNLGRLINVQVFNTAGTFAYTPTAGAVNGIVEVQGGGGSGAGAVATPAGWYSAGHGGSAGGYHKCRLSSLSAQTITIGIGGVGASGAAGTSGGTSSFGALITCAGGAAAVVSAGLNASGIFSGLIAVSGAATGTTGTVIESSSGGFPSPALLTGTSGVSGGKGGESHFGGAGWSGFNVVSSAGAAAFGYGSGGGGAINAPSQAAATGGNGKNGIVIVWEYA